MYLIVIKAGKTVKYRYKDFDKEVLNIDYKYLFNRFDCKKVKVSVMPMRKKRKGKET